MNKKKELISFLETILTEERLNTLNRVIENRTTYLTVAIENVYQPHNASAVLRSCECFGIQNVHIIENSNEYNVNPEISLGSSNWLNVIKYNSAKNNTLNTINKLKSDGYRIVATTPHTNDVSLDEFDINKGKVALLFGTEQEGLSEIALENADEFLKIPMYGFTESFNISVSAAIILNRLTTILHNSEIDFKLNNEEHLNVKLKWLIHSLKKPELLIADFCKKNNIDASLFI